MASSLNSTLSENVRCVCLPTLQVFSFQLCELIKLPTVASFQQFVVQQALKKIVLESAKEEFFAKIKTFRVVQKDASKNYENGTRSFQELPHDDSFSPLLTDAITLIVRMPVLLNIELYKLSEKLLSSTSAISASSSLRCIVNAINTAKQNFSGVSTTSADFCRWQVTRLGLDNISQSLGTLECQNNGVLLELSPATLDALRANPLFVVDVHLKQAPCVVVKLDTSKIPISIRNFLKGEKEEEEKEKRVKVFEDTDLSQLISPFPISYKHHHLFADSIDVEIGNKRQRVLLNKKQKVIDCFAEMWASLSLIEDGRGNEVVATLHVQEKGEDDDDEKMALVFVRRFLSHASSFCLLLERIPLALPLDNRRSLTEYNLFYWTACRLSFGIGANNLDLSKPLVEQNITPLSTIDCYLNESAADGSRFDMYIKTLSGNTITLRPSLLDTVDQVKNMIFEKDGIPQSEQRLIFRGRQWDDGRLLIEYNVFPECTVHLVLRLRGGGAMENLTGTEFVDVTKRKAVERHQFSSTNTAPRWRRVAPGLCIEGRCSNMSCEAYGEMVIGNFYFDRIDITTIYSAKSEQKRTKKRLACPACRTTIPPTTCAFNRCCWRFSGIRKVVPKKKEIDYVGQRTRSKSGKQRNQDEEAKNKEEREGEGKEVVKRKKEEENEVERVVGEWTEADDAYHRFNEEKAGMCTWLTLVLEARPSEWLTKNAPLIFTPSPSPPFSLRSFDEALDAQCAICLERIVDEKTSVTLGCRHAFHLHCERRWISAAPTNDAKNCLLCQQQVTNDIAALLQSFDKMQLNDDEDDQSEQSEEANPKK